MAGELRGRRVVLRPLARDDREALRAIVAEPEVARWWGEVGADFPEADEPEATRYVILVDGETAGMIQYGEELDPSFRHASIDVFLAPAHHGRGLGTEAVETMLRHLVEGRGHHRVTIDPALDNAAAVRAYEKAGFERVGVMRRYWRDASGRWRDGLLLEHVVDE